MKIANAATTANVEKMENAAVMNAAKKKKIVTAANIVLVKKIKAAAANSCVHGRRFSPPS